MIGARTLAVALAGVLLAACGGSSVQAPASPSRDGGGSADAATVPADVSTGPDGAQGMDVMVPPPVDDGAPRRLASCTSSFGSALTAAYGRLDGYLVGVLPPGHRGCNGDTSHVHLQVMAGGAVYDVAVTATSQVSTTTPDVALATVDVPLPAGPWAEGWHPGPTPIDYPTTLGLHSQDFTPMAPADLTTRIEMELQSVNHISVFATGYGPTGAHLVHRNSGHDGAIVVHPLSPTAHLLVFHFATQNF